MLKVKSCWSSWSSRRVVRGSVVVGSVAAVFWVPWERRLFEKGRAVNLGWGQKLPVCRQKGKGSG